MHCTPQLARKSLSWRQRGRRVLGSSLLVACGVISHAQSQVAPSDVEAAYLYNFGKFVDWPTQPELSSTPFTICVLGKDDFGPTIDSLIANEKMQGRSIVSKRLRTLANAETCQILYVGSSEQSRMAKDLDALKEKPILTVSSLPGFLEHGGTIQFVLADNRVRFAVNLASATRSHLVLSTELLKVALYVNSRPPQEGQ